MVVDLSGIQMGADHRLISALKQLPGKFQSDPVGQFGVVFDRYYR